VQRLRGEGHDVGLLDMHTVKPVDRQAVLMAAATGAPVITVEEHNVVGGLGAAVAELLAEKGSRSRLRRHGIPDEYSLIGPPTHLYRHYGLEGAGIEAVVREELEKNRPIVAAGAAVA
jgi:transketolase